jgi:hypothetical protein
MKKTWKPSAESPGDIVPISIPAMTMGGQRPRILPPSEAGIKFPRLAHLHTLPGSSFPIMNHKSIHELSGSTSLVP